MGFNVWQLSILRISVTNVHKTHTRQPRGDTQGETSGRTNTARDGAETRTPG